MPRRTTLFLLLAIAVAAGIGWWWHAHRPPGTPQWQGYAEADFVKVAPTQQGLLTGVAVVRGQEVTAGAPLFVQDETSDLAARDQAARQLRQAQDQLANLKAAGKQTEIEQAAANLTDAHSTLVRTKADLDRAENLVQTGAVTVQTLDQRRADHRSAQARGPMGRPEEIKAQRALVEASEAALKMADWRLAQRRVAAPVAARVADVLARPGETMAAGQPVVSLLPAGNIFVRFFVAESELGRVHLGDKVALSCDACRSDLTGTVSFISPQAEYTPPVIYSEDSRAKLVFLIEARPAPEQAVLFNPGQPVVVRPIAQDAAR